MIKSIRGKCANCEMIYEYITGSISCPRCGSNAFDEISIKENITKEQLNDL